jgi:hypothetical protein
MRRYVVRCIPAALFLAGVLMLGDAGAVDGNYVSPYQTQGLGRSGAASLPLETLFGAFLLSLNLLAIIVLAIRNRRRQKL